MLLLLLTLTPCIPPTARSELPSRSVSSWSARTIYQTHASYRLSGRPQSVRHHILWSCCCCAVAATNARQPLRGQVCSTLIRPKASRPDPIDLMSTPEMGSGPALICSCETADDVAQVPTRCPSRAIGRMTTPRSARLPTWPDPAAAETLPEQMEPHTTVSQPSHADARRRCPGLAHATGRAA